MADPYPLEGDVGYSWNQTEPMGRLGEIQWTYNNRYYNELTGSPMFIVDFGGSIGVREVHVYDTELDGTKQFSGLEPVSNSASAVGAGPFAASSSAAVENEPDWLGAWEDFASLEAGTISSSDEEGSFLENAANELGLYNANEDLLGWMFEQFFADSQWQEIDFIFVQDTENFSGPQPRPTMPQGRKS
jgi:hypothetical protein